MVVTLNFSLHLEPFVTLPRINADTLELCCSKGCSLAHSDLNHEYKMRHREDLSTCFEYILEQQKNNQETLITYLSLLPLL